MASCIQCHRDQNNTRNRANRVKVLKHYGGDPPKCACCSENKLEFLSLDHIHGGGNKQRQSIKIRWWEWLLKNNLPTGFRVLCHNCNQAIGVYGYCPHDGFSKLDNAIHAYDELGPNKSYKLTKVQVDEIRRLLDNGVTGVSISNKYKISRAAVSLIKKGKTWRH